MACVQVTQVAVAVIRDQQGRVLISKRPDHVHQGGKWEFPGGKLEAGEDVETALVRELREELDITPLDYRPLIRLRHDYPDKAVLLDVLMVDAFSGTAHGREGQRVTWNAIDELETEDFPEANAAIVKAIKLPDRHLITGDFANTGDFEQRLYTALTNGIRLVQLRLTQQWLASGGNRTARDVIAVSRGLCHDFAARLMFNLPADNTIEAGTDEGIHLNSRRLMHGIGRPEAGLVSASCHNERELDQAYRLGLDFALLSPVQNTVSHPGAETLGWPGFQALSEKASLPVFALGGMHSSDLEKSWQYGAQGIAAISEFWNIGRSNGDSGL